MKKLFSGCLELQLWEVNRDGERLSASPERWQVILLLGSGGMYDRGRCGKQFSDSGRYGWTESYRSYYCPDYAPQALRDHRRSLST